MKNVKNKTLVCPKCGSKNTADITYGLVDYDKDLEKDLDDGRIVLGGCIVSDDDPEYYCNDCQNKWIGRKKHDTDTY